MTQYLLSVHGNEEKYAQVTPEEMQIRFKATDEFNTEIMASVHWVFGGGLQPADTATVVRAEGGEVLTTDGPYMETKEHIGGFWIIEAADLDEAMAIAARGSAACVEAVEVRPFQEDPEG